MTCAVSLELTPAEVSHAKVYQRAILSW